MKVLHLTLKKKWFDMIASREKNEEYREIKWYWARRLTTVGLFPPCVRDEFCRELSDSRNAINDTLRQGNASFLDYDFVCLRNGYHKNSKEIILRCDGISIGEGLSDWGAEPGTSYFVIKLGDIITH